MFKAILNFDLLDSRSKRQFTNILVSAIMKGAAIFCSFLLVPVCLEYLDVKSYGIWLTITSVVSWISFLDGGLGNGLKNKLSEALANNDRLTASKLISSAYLGIVFIALTLLAFFLIVFNLIDISRLFKSPDYMATEVQYTFFVVLTCFCIKLVF